MTEFGRKSSMLKEKKQSPVSKESPYLRIASLFLDFNIAS
uniref:Uncharacterized protein n=1 Tax=Utricularia reniformis TaxID=192314 RepID=A0A1Y0B1H2_9LAMI|nr:hypothetical protein AEK19_MT1000 [Utricularia reniformis]ART31224.1 hypothetical protein AEK19_MT1000 [Utricularia reniformis]